MMIINQLGGKADSLTQHTNYEMIKIENNCFFIFQSEILRPYHNRDGCFLSSWWCIWSNAVKYHEEEEVTLFLLFAATERNLYSVADDELVFLHEIKKIFDRFYQLTAHTHQIGFWLGFNLIQKLGTVDALKGEPLVFKDMTTVRFEVRKSAIQTPLKAH